MHHVDFTRLFLIASGTLEAAESRKTREHLDSCADCRAESRLAQLLWKTVRADRMADPPERLVSRAISLWKNAHPGPIRAAVRKVTDRARRTAQVLRGSLVFDSLTAAAAAAVRSSGSMARQVSSQRRLVFTAGDYDIDISIEQETPGRRRRSKLRGQVLPREGAAPLPPGSEIAATAGKGRAVCSVSDPHGGFTLESLHQGRHRLSISSRDLSIVIERIEVN